MSPMAHATAMFAITVSVLVWTLGQVQGHSATTFAFANTGAATATTAQPTASPDSIDTGKQEEEKLKLIDNWINMEKRNLMLFITGGKNTSDAVVRVNVINTFDEEVSSYLFSL